MHKVYIAIGSNLNNPFYQVNSAIKAVSNIPNSICTSISSFWKTSPYDNSKQPDYLNAVIAIETLLSPEALLICTQEIECMHGRDKIRKKTFGPRTLDIDILLYDKQYINSKKLVIPHYDIKNRIFFLMPLIEIFPNAVLPGDINCNKYLSKLSGGKITLWK